MDIYYSIRSSLYKTLQADPIDCCSYWIYFELNNQYPLTYSNKAIAKSKQLAKTTFKKAAPKAKLWHDLFLH